MKLKALQTITKSLTHDFGDENELNVTYRPYTLTPELEELNKKVTGDASLIDVYKRQFIPVISSWDFMDEYEVITSILPRIKHDDGEITELFVQDGKLVEAYRRDCVFDKSGKTQEMVIPITEKGLYKVPVEALFEILMVIRESVTPGKKTQTNSNGSLSQKEKEEILLPSI